MRGFQYLRVCNSAFSEFSLNNEVVVGYCCDWCCETARLILLQRRLVAS